MKDDEKIIKIIEDFKSMKLSSKVKLDDLLYNLSEVDDFYKELKNLLNQDIYNSLTKNNLDLLLEALVDYEINSRELIRNLKEARSTIKKISKKVAAIIDG